MDIEGATNATLTFANVMPSDAGTYSVAVSNPSGTLLSAPAVLEVIAVPFINYGPFANSASAKETAYFYVNADGAPPLFFQWRFNGTNLPNATNSDLLLTNVQPAADGLYSVVISNAFGLVISPEARLTVFFLPVIVSYPQDQVAFAGETAFFSVGVGGPGPYYYQWRFRDANIAGATNDTLVLTNLALSQAGPYSVVVNNEYGSVTGVPANLQVLAVVITAQPANLSAFEGGNVTLRVDALPI